MIAPSRPVLRYMGGKWKLAPWIIRHLPPHRIYVEPFGGAASILLRKPPSYSEVYNDLDGDVVNLFRVLRDDEQAERLIDLITLTPFARAEFELSYEPIEDPIERARRTVVRSFAGHGVTATNQRRTGFRANAHRNHTVPAHDWATLPPALRMVVDRLRGVLIENRPAVDVIRRLDREDVLFYCDPPYMPESRSKRVNRGGLDHAYVHEMSPADHQALLDALKTVRGMVVLSGYPSGLYTKELGGWERLETKAYADGARPRRECLWLNPQASRAHGLFAPRP